MAHTGIFATSDEILVKAGEYYDTSITEARINALCLQAESYINVATKYNWSDDYAGLNVDVKYILSMLESDLVASYIIEYNILSYPDNTQAQIMLDFLRDRITQTMEILKTKDYQDFIIVESA